MKELLFFKLLFSPSNKFISLSLGTYFNEYKWFMYKVEMCDRHVALWCLEGDYILRVRIISKNEVRINCLNGLKREVRINLS